MSKISEVQYSLIDKFVRAEMDVLHQKKYKKLQGLKLEDILAKNMYLFKSKYLITPEEVIKSVIDAYISSSEESTFGNLLEKIAIYISGVVDAGNKSAVKGIDLEFTRGGTRYLIDIKSGPNWGNSNQIEKMQMNFKTARKVLNTSGGAVTAQFINGCCYGVDDSFDKGDYWKLCGQRFWEFLTDDSNFYLRIIEPIGHQAKERSEAFGELFTQKLIAFSGAFHQRFVDGGTISWERLIIANSGKKK